MRPLIYLELIVASSILTSLTSIQLTQSRVQLFVTPWTEAHQASLSINNSQSLLKLMSIESVMPSNHLILYHSSLLLPSIFPSIRVFSNESVLCIRWPKYWRFSFNISPSNEYSGLISFRGDWFDLITVQGSLKSLLQHQNSKAYPGYYQGIRRRVWKKEGGWSHKRKGISDWERYGSSEASWRSIYAEG